MGYPVLEAHTLDSLLLDNVSQYLTTTSCPATDSKYVFSGDFTIEAWINMTTLPAVGAAKTIIHSMSPGPTGKSFWLSIGNINGQLYLQFFWSTDGLNWLNINSAANNGTVQAPYTFQAATWYHVVALRSGNNYNLFINGFLVGQYNAGSAVANFAGPCPITIGVDPYTYTSFFNGYISNLRIVKGIAVYTAASNAGTTYFANSTVSYTNPNPDNTRSFVPPTTDLSATQSSGTNINAIGGNSTVNTSLLVCKTSSGSSYTAAFTDNSSYAQPINSVGYNASVNRVGYTALPYPGYFSTSFSGATQALSTAITANTSWNMGQGDFTVEAWVYINTLAVNTGIVSAWAGSLAAPTANACCFSLTTGSTNAANVRFTVSNTSVATGYESTIGGLTTGTWNHVAAVRIANTLNIYTNGVKTYAGTAAAETTNINCANAVCVIGAVSTTNSFINAYISNARVTKAVGAYSNTFTPYPYPLANSLTSNTGLTNYNTIAAATGTASGVQLLACRYRTLTPENSFNAYALTSTGAPVAFANTIPQYAPTDNNLLNLAFQPKYPAENPNTYLTASASANFNLGTGAFTIEGWINTSGIATGPTFISSMPTGTASVGNWAFGLTTTGFLTLNYDGGASTINATSLAITANTWNHIAVTRSAGGAYTFYVNGTATTNTVFTPTSTQYGNTSNPIWIGGIQYTGPTQFLFGYANNIRITKGIVVYTGAFTPPTGALTTTQSAGTNIAAIPSAANVVLLVQSNSTTGAISDTSPTASTIGFVGNIFANVAGSVNTTTNSVYTTVNNLKTSEYKQTTSAPNPLLTVRKLAQPQSATSSAGLKVAKAATTIDAVTARKLAQLQSVTSSAGLNVAKAATTIDAVTARKNVILLSQVSVKALIPYFKQYTAVPDIPINVRKNAILNSTTAGIDKSIPNIGSITLVNDVYPTTLYKQLNTTTFQFWS
jgi:hypothetical protein